MNIPTVEENVNMKLTEKEEKLNNEFLEFEKLFNKEIGNKPYVKMNELTNFLKKTNTEYFMKNDLIEIHFKENDVIVEDNENNKSIYYETTRLDSHIYYSQEGSVYQIRALVKFNNFTKEKKTLLSYSYNPKTGTVKNFCTKNHLYRIISKDFIISFFRKLKTINLNENNIQEITKEKIKNIIDSYAFYCHYTEDELENLLSCNIESFYGPLLTYLSNRKLKLTKSIKEDLFVHEIKELIEEKKEEIKESYLNCQSKREMKDKNFYFIYGLEKDDYTYLITFNVCYPENYLHNSFLDNPSNYLKSINQYETKSSKLIKQYALVYDDRTYEYILKKRYDINEFLQNTASYSKSNSFLIRIDDSILNDKYHYSFDKNISNDNLLKRIISLNEFIPFKHAFLDMNIPITNIELLLKNDLNINALKYIKTVLEQTSRERMNIEQIDLLNKNFCSCLINSQNKLYDLFPFSKSYVKFLSENGHLNENIEYEYLFSMNILFKEGYSVENANRFLERLKEILEIDEPNNNYILYLRKFRMKSFLEQLYFIKQNFYPTKTLESILKYILTVQQSEFIELPSNILNMLSDTLKFAKDLNVPINGFPKVLTIEHNKLAYFHRKYLIENKNEIMSEKAREDLMFENDEFAIIPCRNSNELINEGNSLNHCVGSYSSRIINDESSILFLRKKEDISKPYITIEVKRNRITQLQGNSGRRNSFNKETENFIENWIKDKDLINYS